MELPWLNNSGIVLTLGVVVLGIALAFVAIQAGRAVFQALLSPLKNVPGPFLARYTRLWELSAVIRGNIHCKTVELHQKYGLYSMEGPPADRC